MVKLVSGGRSLVSVVAPRLTKYNDINDETLKKLKEFATDSTFAAWYRNLAKNEKQTVNRHIKFLSDDPEREYSLAFEIIDHLLKEKIAVQGGVIRYVANNVLAGAWSSDPLKNSARQMLSDLDRSSEVTPQKRR